MRDFHMTESAALDYPTDRAFALQAFHYFAHPSAVLDLTMKGYLAQEVDRLKGGFR